ncbi:hypothetical protein GGS26DRAFT_583671 [Hypomontagnella submonticulosa]|nr:hypothetical protein GGS26DRAFT_583671 [Hypomontagnella submonticulosa]
MQTGSDRQPCKGSQNRRPKITYPSADPNGKLSHRAAEAVFRTPLPEPLVRERQRQRRISRSKHGVRVSRRLPSRGTRDSMRGDDQYSLMRVSEFTEDHPYWGTLRRSQIYYPEPRTVNASHVQAIEGGRYPTFKQEYDAINRSLDQQRRLTNLIIPEETALDFNQQLEIPSRTSSQRRALNRFTRQLEKYADATGAAGRPPLITPTESESKMSYHTIQPLVPYREELQAAGLAVTSADQSRRSPVKPRDYQVPAHHLPGDTMGPEQMRDELGGQGDGTSEHSYTIDQPIESLPTVEHKSKQKLSKKPPTTRIVKDSQVQSRAKTIHPQNRSYPRPSKLVKSPVNVATPRKPFREEPSSIEVKQDKYRPAPQRSGPEPGAGQPAMRTGLRKRDVAGAPLPRPEIFEEEKEVSPTRPRQTRVQIYPKSKPRDEPKDTPIFVPVVNEQQQHISPRTVSSTIPSLPTPALYAASRTSSLERALDEVSQQLDKMEREAYKPVRLRSSPPTLLDKTNQQEQDASPGHSSHHASGQRKPGKSKEVLYVDRKMPQVGSSDPKPKKLSRSPPKPTRQPPTPPKKHSLPDLPEKMLPTLPKTEDDVKDLDVFFDYEDADINDRDVIKGLQVAIHAAADNRYDALIRDRTGLRIRRFLADLRAVGEMEQEKPADRQDREQRTEPKGKGLRRIQDRKSVHRAGL